MTTKITDKELSEFKDAEIDDLLSKLTEAEIDELNSDIDPDNHLLPPSQRCRDQTTKGPTGPFDREKLIKFIEEKSKNEKDWDNITYEKKVRGKVFEQKEKKGDDDNSKKVAEMGFDVEVDEEFDDILKNATEEELVDLAAILGFNGMMNQVQYYASVENKEQMLGGFQGVAKSEPCKPVKDEEDNDTNVDEVIEKLKKNDSGLTEVTLNNLIDVTSDQIKQLCEALHDNTSLKKLDCANISLRPMAAEPILSMMEKNNSLTVLNLESNYLSGEFIVKLLKAINRESCTLKELRLANQQQKVWGVRSEQEITELVLANKTLQILGIDLDTADAKIRIRDHLVITVDTCTRQARGKSKEPQL